ncbi:MAG: tRNA1(Val) (adenine(37)-N6)-methyltransferase [Alphaproteobacteria bacterium]
MNDDRIHVLGGQLELLQPLGGFKTSIDAVLLGAACPAEGGERVLDLGCGVGSAGLCTLSRVAEARLTGIDILPRSVELAEKNAALNGQDARAAFIAEDIRDYEGGMNADGHGEFDHVICNPPYLEAGAHIQSPSPEKQTAIGFGEDDIDLKDWIDAAYRNIKVGGSFTMINRADHTDKIIQGFGRKFGAVEIIPLWPKLSMPAKRVIIRARKDRKSPSVIHAGVILHRENGEYTDAAEAILRDGKALF